MDLERSISTIVTEECPGTVPLVFGVLGMEGNATPLFDVATAAHGAFAKVDRMMLDKGVTTLSGGIIGVCNCITSC